MSLPDSFETLGKAPFERKGCRVPRSKKVTPVEVSGRVIIHSCPRALISHVEWNLSRQVEDLKPLVWNPQPAEPTSMRTEFEWAGDYALAAKLASSLNQIGRIRAEINTHPHDDALGERFLVTPSLGIHRGVIDASGDCVIGEQSVRKLIFEYANEARKQGAMPSNSQASWEFHLLQLLDEKFGAAWDLELDVFRSAAYGADIRWLSSTA